MQIFRVLAGYSLGRADIVRRAMGKKKADVMEQERQIFVHGLVRGRWHRGGGGLHPARRGRKDGARYFPRNGELFRLRIQQIPCRAVCACLLSDGVAEMPLSEGIHGRSSHQCT